MKTTHSLHRPSRHLMLSAALASALAVGTVAALAPQQAHAGVFVSVNFAPPVLPVYAQPPIPGPGYIWTPGYWAYGPAYGYYWVPGTWVMPPYVGALWTPGYWGWANGAYVFHDGYWGLHVGYYGGINYGFGYCGVGYLGGYWRGGGFYYNRTVNNITNVHITNVYSRNVVSTTASRASFNGPNGITARPTTQELAYRHESRTAPIAAQVAQRTDASHIEGMRATVNHGRPAVAATPTPRAFGGTSLATHGSAAANTTRTATTPVSGMHSPTYAPRTGSSATARVTTTPTNEANRATRSTSVQSTGNSLHSTTYVAHTTTAHATGTTHGGGSPATNRITSTTTSHVPTTGNSSGRRPAYRETSRTTAPTSSNTYSSVRGPSSTVHATPHTYAAQAHPQTPSVTHAKPPPHGSASTDKDRDGKPERH